MNISQGISSIQVNSTEGSARSAKLYLWPKLTDRPVDKIKRLTPEKNAEFVIRKADADTQERIVTESMINREPSYNSRGKILSSSAPVHPGSLFEAYA